MKTTDNTGYAPMPANPAHGKFTASQYTGEFAGTSHSQSLAAIKKMKKTVLLIITISTFFSCCNSQVTDNESITFEMLLDSTNMVFEIPENFVEVNPIENNQMNYEKAFKHPTDRFEVRYAIRRHQFEFYKQIFEMTVLNISGGQLPEYTQFGSKAVNSEFGADAGLTTTVQLGEEFGQDYKFCLLVYLHKNGVGDGYIFYLADDKEIIPNLMRPIFHALKFKHE